MPDFLTPRCISDMWRKGILVLDCVIINVSEGVWNGVQIYDEDLERLKGKWESFGGVADQTIGIDKSPDGALYDCNFSAKNQSNKESNLCAAVY